MTFSSKISVRKTTIGVRGWNENSFLLILGLRFWLFKKSDIASKIESTGNTAFFRNHKEFLFMKVSMEKF